MLLIPWKCFAASHKFDLIWIITRLPNHLNVPECHLIAVESGGFYDVVGFVSVYFFRSLTTAASTAQQPNHNVLTNKIIFPFSQHHIEFRKKELIDENCMRCNGLFGCDEIVSFFYYSYGPLPTQAHTQNFNWMFNENDNEKKKVASTNGEKARFRLNGLCKQIWRKAISSCWIRNEKKKENETDK